MAQHFRTWDSAASQGGAGVTAEADNSGVRAGSGRGTGSDPGSPGAPDSRALPRRPHRLLFPPTLYLVERRLQLGHHHVLAQLRAPAGHAHVCHPGDSPDATARCAALGSGPLLPPAEPCPGAVPPSRLGFSRPDSALHCRACQVIFSGSGLPAPPGCRQHRSGAGGRPASPVCGDYRERGPDCGPCCPCPGGLPHPARPYLCRDHAQPHPAGR